MNKTLARICFGGWVLLAFLDMWSTANLTMNLWTWLSFAVYLFFIWYFVDKI